ncbi:MAG: fumarylacetoacetate hydrolase family protein [Pseudomonadota bacterium]|jgi:2-keto-4-pentenoate hydratase/2-oxohepta-3-ene-1,7-dioic acid hydratase in catechol pathway
MAYRHLFADGAGCDLPPGKTVCVGLNYAAHVAEMGSAVAAEPVLFIKPRTALVPFAGELAIPLDRGACHFETEVALLIGAPLRRAAPETARRAVAGVGLALDLTLRDLQRRLKQAGHPWERAKGFDGACAVSALLHPEGMAFDALAFSLEQNGICRQRGCTRELLTPIPQLLSYISDWFTLEPGDLVLTGTPEGVGPLAPGDELVAQLDGRLRAAARVVAG